MTWKNLLEELGAFICNLRIGHPAVCRTGSSRDQLLLLKLVNHICNTPARQKNLIPYLLKGLIPL